MVLASLTGYGQNVGEQFTVGDIKYKITSISPHAVRVVGYTGPEGVTLTLVIFDQILFGVLFLISFGFIHINIKQKVPLLPI